jgi:hypothetical protein
MQAYLGVHLDYIVMDSSWSFVDDLVFKVSIVRGRRWYIHG